LYDEASAEKAHKAYRFTVDLSSPEIS
jgi:hypothetical protein